MRFTSCCAVVLGALSLVSASFVVPKGTADGIYEITEGSKGEQVMTWIADLTDAPNSGLLSDASDIESAASSTGRRLSKRAKSAYECFPVSLIRNDIQRAATNLGNTCDTGASIKPKGTQVAVSGDVVVYACNSSSRKTINCRSGDLNPIVGFLEDNCLTNRAGEYIYRPAPGNYLAQTYGYTNQGETLCHFH